MPDIDSYLRAIKDAVYGEEVRGSIHDAIEVINDAVDVNTEIVSSPLTASLVENMTDTTKVYVYTGTETGYVNGNWYYWDGSAWVSGGVYHGIPSNLSIDSSDYLCIT